MGVYGFPQIQPPMKDYSLDPIYGSLLAVPVVVGLLAFVWIPHWLLWGEFALDEALVSVPFALQLIILVASVLVHEALHAVAWAWAGGLSLAQIEFGVLWKALAPYAHPKVPLSAGAYRLGVVAPGLLLGLIPSLLGILFGWSIFSGWGGLLLAFAAGDALILWTIRHVSEDTLVRDHPSRFGCQVVE